MAQVGAPQGRGASFGSGVHCRPPIAALHDVTKRKVASVLDRWLSVDLDAAPGPAAAVRRVGEDADLELVDEGLVGVGAGAHAHEPARRARSGARDVQRVEGHRGRGRAGRRPAHARHRADRDADGAAVAVPRIGDDPRAEGELVVAARLARTVVDRVAQLPRRPGGVGAVTATVADAEAVHGDPPGWASCVHVAVKVRGPGTAGVKSTFRCVVSSY